MVESDETTAKIQPIYAEESIRQVKRKSSLMTIYSIVEKITDEP